MDIIREYEDFLDLRRQETSNFLWVSRRWNPTLAFKQQNNRPTPQSHKAAVLNSPKIQELLDQLSLRGNISKSIVEGQVREILDEIGYDRKFKVVRWLGLVLTKICLKVLTGIYVNVEQVEKLRNRMGKCPVIFVPTHRSYGDFIMMSYVTFVYNVEIPAIAAGMDFHGMWGMGTMLRDTGAFFMRRTYNDDNLYWATFRQYINQIVSKGDLPIEFFIEGTRSRSNKSLSPKYGLFTMVLKALFCSQVPDILFVPIGISYDRILEESLFAFELLGVPKPKESTSGFFKSMKILKESFGNIYVHIDKPISAKEFFGEDLDRSIHNLASSHHQEITDDEKKLLPPLAYEILNRQQKVLVITVFNLISLIVSDNLGYKEEKLTVEELAKELQWFRDILRIVGGFVHTNNIERGIKDSLNTHKNLLTLNKDRTITLISNKVSQGEVNHKKLKAHALSDAVMTYSVPFVMLQIYINPVLQYFVDINIILVILDTKHAREDELFENYHFLRSIFAREFIILSPKDRTVCVIPSLPLFSLTVTNKHQHDNYKFLFLYYHYLNASKYTVLLETFGLFDENYQTIEKVFNSALNNSVSLNLVQLSNGSYQLGDNDKLRDLVVNTFKTFYISFFATLVTLEGLPQTTDEKSILANAQKILEDAITKKGEFIHPYSLNLDSLGNCLASLVDMKILQKSRRDNQNIYEINKTRLLEIRDNFVKFVPKHCIQETCQINSDHLKNKL